MAEMADWNRSIPRSELWGGCRACIHFRKDTTCAAYPDGIPIVIASGEVDHLVVRPGQVGDTVFAPRAAAMTESPTATHLRHS
jgi:hypothetical protein